MDLFLTLKYVEYSSMALALLISARAYYLKRTREFLTLLILLSFLMFHNSISVFIPSFRTNTIWINFLETSILVELILYYPIFYLLIKQKAFKRIIAIWLISLVLLAIVSSLCYYLHLANYNNYAYSFGGLGILLSIILYLYESFKIGLNPLKQFWFWISTGLFIFLSVNIPFLLVFHFLQQEKTIIEYEMEMYIFRISISIFYYLIFIIATKCMTKK